jgi:hypothetical protein
MSNKTLDNLVGIKKLKAEPFDAAEFAGLIRSAQRKLKDARNTTLSPESRFDLAYNAAHSLALAALRFAGYRSDGRYLVFQTLEHTAGLPPAKWRVLSKCHDARNLAEYEGQSEVDEKLLAELIELTGQLEGIVVAMLKRS